MPKEPIIVVENANPTAVAWSRSLADSSVQDASILCGLSSDPQHNRSINLLDFGCGFGRYLELFQDFIPPENLVGIESCQDSIAQVREKGFRCLEADSEIPFEDGHFDVVFSSNVIEHIPRPKYLKYLEEIERVLRPGGRFVVGTPNYHGSGSTISGRHWSPGYIGITCWTTPPTATNCPSVNWSRTSRDISRMCGYAQRIYGVKRGFPNSLTT